MTRTPFGTKQDIEDAAELYAKIAERSLAANGLPFESLTVEAQEAWMDVTTSLLRKFSYRSVAEIVRFARKDNSADTTEAN